PEGARAAYVTLHSLSGHAADGALGPARTGRGGHLHQLDAGWTTAASGVRRHARGQARDRGGPGAAARGARPAAHRGAARAGRRLTHPDRVLWPELGVTKLELARYYIDIADWILPHVAGRPLAVVRGPRGHAGTTFFQKHLAAGMPAPIRSIRLEDEEGEKDH